MTFTKDPDAVLDYSVDWFLWLAGDQISSSEWILEEGATIEKITDTFTTSRTVVWLGRGDKGITYLVTNRIVTAGGRTDDRTISVKVEDR
jgi:hypothetical protein